MGKGAVHPNGSNFCRSLKYNIVDKMRKLIETNLYDRPRWLEWSERAPPIEIYNISLKSKYNNNKYIDLVKFLLKKYPHLRFQDCFVEGNNNVKAHLSIILKRLRNMRKTLENQKNSNNFDTNTDTTSKNNLDENNISDSNSFNSKNINESSKK
ncbi:hypothetical protein [Plasmodium yoelii yoelii]|uniref:Small ribosomal subunit protein mS23 n=1 Tax=Plasmodium yoelii yoelii TaxID=73239 RepID=Q7RPZ6_PLAYO|nr:hypothetical protein [Plasmodium yoelii yoelii]